MPEAKNQKPNQMKATKTYINKKTKAVLRIHNDAGFAELCENNSTQAISKYGKEFCIWAAQENKEGNGANTISWSFPKESGLQGRTRSADAAIDAGREILNN
jgi:hypothetical protein